MPPKHKRSQPFSISRTTQTTTGRDHTTMICMLYFSAARYNINVCIAHIAGAENQISSLTLEYFCVQASQCISCKTLKVYLSIWLTRLCNRYSWRLMKLLSSTLHRSPICRYPVYIWHEDKNQVLGNPNVEEASTKALASWCWEHSILRAFVYLYWTHHCYTR